MTARPTYIWSICCAWGLTIAVGALTVSGVLATFLDASEVAGIPLRNICILAFACVVALALANANNAAAAAQHAASRKQVNLRVLIPAVLCAIGFVSASVIGVDLGWGVLAGNASEVRMPETRTVLLVGGLLGFAKIAMSWIIEGRKAMDKADADEAERQENARLDAIRQQDIAARSPNVTRLPSRPNTLAMGAAALALGVGAGAPHQPAEAAPMVQLDAPQKTASEAPVKRVQTHAKRTAKKQADYEARLSAARQMVIERGAEKLPSNREIARRSGASASSVDRLVRDMMPLGNAVAAA